ncbi:hypothetical protein H5410_048002 [Solanum commersonii]|uniref:Uncharacterized protein n=1 Tax=Solanum commersonii TaxID=4109 RepID=A0A9J5XKM9_SOLCO|nr:hypothetical protein H5410_048002 [Solanum commersonii]
MGKNYQMMNKERESQGQGVCEKIFKLAVNISPTFRSFRQNSPQFVTNTKPKIDHQRNYTTNISKPVAIVDQLELNRQQIPSQNLSTASNNMVLVEYNHIAGENSATTRKFKGEPMKDVNKSSVKNMISIVHHHEINEGPKDDNDRFSNYIDHVKNKMRSISNFDDKYG